MSAPFRLVPFRLVIEAGPNAGQRFTISEGGTTIGRQDGNTIVLDDGRLSRQHARIDQSGEALTITDLGSANGTRLNGRPISGVQPLNAGDRIQLGETTIAVEGGPQPERAVAPAAAALPGLPTTPLRPEGAGQAPRLIIQGGEKTFTLDRPTMIAGRQQGNDITLDDTQASRQHARFEVAGGQLTVTDLGSANGTRVNGARIEGTHALRDGDLVQIGTSQLRVAGLGPASAPPPPPALGLPPSPAVPPELAPTSIGIPGLAPPGGGAAPPGSFAPPPAPGLAPPRGEGWNPPPPPGGAGLGSPPPLGAPPPAFGAPAPPQPQIAPLPPPATARSSSRAPLIIGVVLVLLLLCGGGSVAGAVLFLRDRGDPTPTPAATSAARGTAVSSGNGTPVAGGSPATNPGTAVAIAGNGGGNTAPPAPGASVPPTAAPSTAASASPRPSAATSVAPSARPSTAPSAAPSARPSGAPSAAPSARPSSAPSSAPGGGSVFTVQGVGLRLTLPAGWTKGQEQTNAVTFVSPNQDAQLTVRWGTATSGLTSDLVLKQELDDTAGIDPAFDPTAVGISPAQIGGRPGSATDRYDYSTRNGPRSEGDLAVVVPGRFQYFFGFLAVQGRFEANNPDFTAIINSIQITPP